MICFFTDQSVAQFFIDSGAKFHGDAINGSKILKLKSVENVFLKKSKTVFRIKLKKSNIYVTERSRSCNGDVRLRGGFDLRC